MKQTAPAGPRWRALEPHWYVLIVLVILGVLLYGAHLFTGFTPGRVAFTIPFLNVDVFWYGIIIMGGVALGAYITSRLARERAVDVFTTTVPLNIRRQPLTKLDLPDEIQAILKKKKLFTVGDALLTWGFHPGYLGLNDDGREELHKALAAIPNMEEVWLEDAPWRIWDPGHTWNGLIWVLILAVIGARIYHILTPSPSMAAIGIESPLDYLRNPLAMIDLRQGGLGIYGGMAGGLLGLLIYTRRARIPLWGWADLGVVGVALGQAIGRWGNFINQELYGRPTDLPWAVSIEPAHRLPEFAEFSSFHPAFLYESLWNLLAFFVLYTLAHRYRQRLFTGDLTAIYLIFYGTGRILLELVRLDSRTVIIGNLDLGLPIATLVSLVVALLAAGWLIWRHYSARRTPQSNASG